MSLPEIDLARYQRADEKAALEEAFINERIAHHMADGCNPYDPVIFLDELCEADSVIIKAMRPLLAAEPRDYAAIGKTICDWVENHLELSARQMAEDDLEMERDWQ